jgi:hypothetical protein
MADSDLCAVEGVMNLPCETTVARMQRSEIRDLITATTPDSVSLHPGYDFCAE